MSEGFRDCFVGEKGYDAIKKSMRSGNEFCLELSKCLQERCEAENAYIRALQKTENSFEKLAGKAKGTLAQALSTLAAEANEEAKAHAFVADTLLNGIAMPMKSLADSQARERKSIEENLNSKLKEWNNQKDTDYKYRSRQFNKCREIEGLLVKINEASSGSKSSARSKTNSASSSLAGGCVRPASRFSSVSEKLEATIKKAEEDLERIEDKYHSATRNVELLRQNFDAEMCRACDKLQKMETERLTELSNYISTYATSIETLSKTMNQITQHLFTIQIAPENDILVQVKSYNEPSEIEVLLYDIYAENEDNVMNEQKRILNLMNWIARLKKDIEIQQQTKNASQSSLRSAPVDNDSPDDDICSSSDGAMCSKQDTVRNSIRQNDESSSNDDDDDGGMYRAKRKEKKKTEASNGRVSSEVFIDRQGAAILEELYRASLYKIETVYNRIKNLPRPNYENADRLSRTYTKDGTPTSLLRLPCGPATRTPPSAPTAMRCFAESMPVYQPSRKRVPTAKAEPPPQPGWNLPYPPGPPAQPLLGACAAASPQAPPPPPNTHVKAVYDYTAEHEDELNLRQGDVIVLLKRRKDGWCQGNLKGKIGFFPGNYVTEL